MEDVRINPQLFDPSPLRDRRRTAGLIAQYIHELSGRHADDRPDRASVREPAGD
ncbi:MAG: hypothetical protein QOC68_2605 [Solirubrobacteraceae bacterium]|nr:hypothetical protein [Solirubrobacteraceae bacterium]